MTRSVAHRVIGLGGDFWQHMPPTGFQIPTRRSVDIEARYAYFPRLDLGLAGNLHRTAIARSGICCLTTAEAWALRYTDYRWRGSAIGTAPARWEWAGSRSPAVRLELGHDMAVGKHHDRPIGGSGKRG